VLKFEPRRKSCRGERGEGRGDGRKRRFSLQLCRGRNHAAAAGVLAASSRFATVDLLISLSAPHPAVALISFF